MKMNNYLGKLQLPIKLNIEVAINIYKLKYYYYLISRKINELKLKLIIITN